jgi:NADH-quinone oxidoreductase subunit C
MKTNKSALMKAYPYLKERESLDWSAFNCPQSKILELLKDLRDTRNMDFLADLTAIDHFDVSPRFEVVYHLYSTHKHEYIRIVTPCTGEADPVCVSVVSLWPTADWHEREAFDMFGIQFRGHPDLRRILMWDGYPYHPLRKEFPLAGKDVDLPSEELAEVTGTSAKPAPMMGGPFHSPQIGPSSKREPRADDESWTETREHEKESLAGNEVPRDLKPNN